MAAPNDFCMSDDNHVDTVVPKDVTVEEENMDKMIEVLGGGKGGGLEIVTALPILEDDNFCRYRCACYDGGFKKFAPVVQYLCLRFDGGFKLVTGMPFLEDENFCRQECLCYDVGCKKFELKFQYLCLKFEV